MYFSSTTLLDIHTPKIRLDDDANFFVSLIRSYLLIFLSGNVLRRPWCIRWHYASPMSNWFLTTKLCVTIHNTLDPGTWNIWPPTQHHYGTIKLVPDLIKMSSTHWRPFCLDLNMPMQTTQISRFMRPTWAHLGPVGPRWAPCWSHEPCCQGNAYSISHKMHAHDLCCACDIMRS